MTLRVTLDRLVFKSIREFEDVDIKLSNGINVIQIRNGYGKTSTLTILRWMFTGNDNIESGDFPKYVRGKEVAGHDYDGKSSVTLHMTIDNDGASTLGGSR